MAYPLRRMIRSLTVFLFLMMARPFFAFPMVSLLRHYHASDSPPRLLHIMKQTNPYHLDRPTERRRWLTHSIRKISSFVAALGPSLGASAASQQEELAEICQDGSLVAESAIPGAYHQECMSLPVRTIPVRTPQSTVVLKLQQQPSGAGSTGLAIWNSSLLLKRLLERIVASDPDWLVGKTVMELGCGAGLVSAASAVLGAGHVIASDGNAQVVHMATSNIHTNELDEKVSIQSLQWGLLNAMDLSETADCVFGADLTYSPGNWRTLAETMATVLKPKGLVIYLSVGHPGFNVNAETDGFLSVAKEQGLVPLGPSDEQWPFPKLRSGLADILLRDGVSANERPILESTGGLRVLVLGARY